MDRDELVAYCLAKPGAEETYPWGEEELVAKVGGKGFAFIGPTSVSVKCGRDAAEAAEWRDRYPGAITIEPLRRALRLEHRRPGPVRCPTTTSASWSTRSYDAAVAALPKSRRRPAPAACLRPSPCARSRQLSALALRDQVYLVHRHRRLVALGHGEVDDHDQDRGEEQHAGPPSCPGRGRRRPSAATARRRARRPAAG